MSLLNPDPSPQFGTAEYPGQPATDRCKACGQPITGSYYRVGSNIACPSCAERLKREGSRDSHATFMRALLFGAGGAVLGLILYSGFTILTGIELGYISLAVGFIVAKAVMMGSKGIGGRRYQIVAVLLTYAAVSMSAVPIGIHFLLQNKKQAATTHVKTAPQSEDGQASHQVGADSVSGPSEKAEPKSAAAAIGYLALLGLASPFLAFDGGNPVSAFIGLVILLVGIRIAWRITAGSSAIEVYGPFENSKSAAGQG